MIRRQTLLIVLTLVACAPAPSEGGPFRRRPAQTCRQPARTYYPPAEPPASAPTCTTPAGPQRALTLAEKVSQILANNGVRPGIISSRDVLMDDPVNYAIGDHWAPAQRPLQELFQQELRLDFKPQLVLVLRENKQSRGMGRFVFTHPSDDRIVDVLSKTLQVPKEMFDPKLKLYGEVQNFEAGNFKAQYLTNGEPNLPRIKSAILGLLQGDADLKKLASRSRGAIKPVGALQSVSKERMAIATEWQEFAGDANIKVYWRLNVTIARIPADQWQLESVIDIGQRYRSQSFNQIHKISDSNRLNAFDTLSDKIEINGSEFVTVKQKVVKSAGEALIPEPDRQNLGEFAPTLWTKVKDMLTHQ